MQHFAKVIIKANPQLDANILESGPVLADLFGLVNGQRIFLCAGQSCKPLTFIINNKQIPAQELRLHPRLLQGKGLYEHTACGIICESNRIRIGPFIGIMADQSTDPNRPFRDQSLFISQLINEGREMGAICFAFSAADINFKNGTIRGVTFQNKSWQQSVYPLPDVIYVRYKGHNLKKSDICHRFSKAGCKFINPALMGKWQSYKILSRKTDFRRFLPETRLLKSFQELDEMLDRYKAVYLKPVSGSQGEKIIRIRQINNSLYVCQYRQNERLLKKNFRSRSDLHPALKKIMGRQAYIVQEQINLIRIQGGPADIRVLVQKNEKGVWMVTGKAGRFGRNGSITSNISGGGRACEVRELLAGYYPDSQDLNKIEQEIDQLSLTAASAIDEHFETVGELGIDVGLDQEGHLWFIEANLKPARKVFNLLGASHTRRLSVQRPLLYARWLAGFEKQ